MKAILRLDAGFGSPHNLALLIEMGYEIYTKPFGTWLSGQLAHIRTDPALTWHKVSQNAEMLASSALILDDFPYPLDVVTSASGTHAQP